MADQIANLELGLSVRTKINAALTAIDDKAPLVHTHVAANITDFTEAAQDAIGTSFDATLAYNDAGNGMGRSAITGDVSIPAASNVATLATVPVLKGGTGATDAATARTNLGLGTIATQAANLVSITGGSITGITDLAIADGGTGASDAATARTNLGLGTIATQAASAVAVTGGTINGTTVGATTASSGAFTTLSASSAISGTGFSTYLASPPAIGGTAAAAGAFTTLSASSTVSGTGFSTYLASPPPIGSTAAAAGAFTTLSASSTISGTGFSTYLASPPAIGGTVAAAITGAPVASTSVLTSGFTTLAAGTLALAMASKGVVQVTPNATGSFTSTVPPAGTRCTLIVLTSGVTSFTMTFGTGFKTAGTLATGTVTAKTFVFQFVSDGTTLIESSRTTAL